MNSIKRWDNIIHIGAGGCASLPGVARNYILVEPHPKLAQNLRAIYAGRGDVTVIEQAISTSSGNQLLQLFNHAQTSSLHEAAQITQLNPGLKSTGQVAIEVCNANKFIDQLALNKKNNNWLILTPNGEEGIILKLLFESGLIELFNRVDVILPMTELYQNSMTAQDLLPLIEKSGKVIVPIDEKDTERPLFRIIANPLSEVIDSLKQKNKDLELDLTVASNKAKAYQERADEGHKLIDEIKQKNKDIEQENERLRYEHQQTDKRQNLLEAELKKAEAQAQLIAEMLLDEDQRNGLKTLNKGAK